MRIRQATTQDLNSIMELYRATADPMVGTPYDCRWRSNGHPTPEFVGGLVQDGGMLVAEENNVLVGCVGIDHDLGHDYNNLSYQVVVPDELVAVIHLLVVRESWRRKGLSRQLLSACLSMARERGMRCARLDATANNLPAIALYQSEGFVIVGEDMLDVGLEDDPCVPFVVMERVL